MKNIIFDLDGTILESDNSLSNETIKCIENTRKNNVVTIATGRSFVGLPGCVLNIENFISYYITSNGTTIYDKNKEVIYKDRISYKDIEFFLCEILNNKKLAVEVLIDGNWHIDEICAKRFKKVNIKPSVLKYVFKTRTRHKDLIDYLIDNDAEIEKISINLCSPISEELKTFIYKLCNDNGLRCYSDHPHKIDVFKKTTNKGTAISFLGKYCGIDLENTISFGNDDNDIEMFEKSSISVCMPNSTKNAKKHSDIVLRKNDNERIKRAFRIIKARGICLG